jgi:hypothetical protein
MVEISREKCNHRIRNIDNFYIQIMVESIHSFELVHHAKEKSRRRETASGVAVLCRTRSPGASPGNYELYTKKGRMPAHTSIDPG